ncbi:DUF6734 family protein [uncultured Bacteroides sp.]|uniref:DUF6734 family protein n=1 Tax=uncultured Bacteroides sp. TaxID=162156 RepID=UPI00338E3DB7
MRIIQSYWSKPIVKMSNWSHFEYHFLTWILSCLRLKKFYPDVSLVTDGIGKRILIDILKLPYNNVSVILNDIQYVNPKIWTYGKLYTYNIQDSSFLHIDGDVIIGRRLPFMNEDLVAQHLELNFMHNKKFFFLLRDKGYILPFGNISKDSSVGEVNAGILGGSDINFFHDYVSIAMKFISDNITRIDNISSSNELAAFNTILEQHIFFMQALRMHKKISVLLPEGHVDDSYVQLANFRQGIYSDYIHPVGYLKSNPLFGEKISELLFKEYPQIFDLFLRNKNRIYKELDFSSRYNINSPLIELFKRNLLKQQSSINIIRFLRETALSSYKVDFMELKFKINPYIKVYKSEAVNQWNMLIPSILSTPEELIIIRINLGILGQFLFSIIQRFKGHSFYMAEIIKLSNKSSEENNKKIIAALRQFIYMHAFVRV